MKHHTVTSDPKREEYVATAGLTDSRVFIQEAAAYTKKDSIPTMFQQHLMGTTPRYLTGKQASVQQPQHRHSNLLSAGLV